MVATDKKKPAEAFAARLGRSLSENGKKLSPTALARDFNLRWRGVPVTVNATRKWLTGQSVPTLDKITVLSSLLGVSADWLRWGEVTMNYRESGSSIVTTKAHIRDVASTSTIPAFQDFLLLTPKHRRLVEAVIETLLKEQNHPEGQQHAE
jgi:hypothetical protein